MKKHIISLFLLSMVYGAHAQSSYYTLFQVGGQFGVNNPGYNGTFNGYSVHFIFGRNFDERGYLGLGLGNETFRGSYQSTAQSSADQSRYDYDTYMLPIFVDGRLPLGYMGASGRFGLLANAGYAPRISAIYDRGFLFKGGVFYLYESLRRTDYTISASYGYQGLSKNFHGENFQHQHIAISVGLMIK